ncbi:MAG: polyphosphate kinase 1 [Phototrophicaceae bacterium]
MSDTPTLPELSPQTFINRELSTIEFQRRVLALANNPKIPLLERVKYIAIVGNNLDEFFMVRVASYLQKVKLRIATSRPDGYTPAQLLERIREEVGDLITEQRHIMTSVFAELANEHIHIVRYADLGEAEKDLIQDYFASAIFPILTPLAADHARPFPFISNLSLNLGVFVQRDANDDLDFARIKVPVDVLPRLISLNQIMHDAGMPEIEGDYFLWIEDVIINNLDVLFPGMDVIEAYPFRVLRNTDIDYEQEQDEDLLDFMTVIEQGVRERRFGSVVRISVPTDISERMLKRLRDGLELGRHAFTYAIDGALGSSDLFTLASISRPKLKFSSFVPRTVEVLSGEFNIFDQIRSYGDVLVHHPYDSFAPVEEFFQTAANDPQVLAIKTTLYRVGKNSPIVEALLDARENDKQVTVLVELKARFDEENNLTWARALEDKGVHVVYGVEELHVKTHAKIALVVRREDNGVRRYLHLGTGNYNASTARLYTDLGLFTCDSTLADDAGRLFNRLTGYGPQTSYQKLLVAPDYLFDTLYDLMEQEIQAARAGKPARLILKMNQLEEDRIIQKLYEASQAGVQVDILVRGHCCLRPGVEGISENIRVMSIIGRFLEHSRVYYFSNAPEEKQLFLGSADLMRRNLYNRVEVVFPVLDATVRSRVLRILATQLADNERAWELQSDGSYIPVQPQANEDIMDSQKIFMSNSFGLDIQP